MNLPVLLQRLFLFLTLAAAGSLQAQDTPLTAKDGKKLFRSNCARCHTASTQKSTGPGLAGVHKKYEREWLYTWIRDSKAMVESGDSLAVAVFEQNNRVPMDAFPDLSKAQIDALLLYIEEAGNKPAAPVGEKPSTEQQVKEWTEVSQGLTAVTVIPLIMLAVLLAVIAMAGMKVPGLD